jgi:hypothetical protein
MEASREVKVFPIEAWERLQFVARRICRSVPNEAAAGGSRFRVVYK